MMHHGARPVLASLLLSGCGSQPSNSDVGSQPNVAVEAAGSSSAAAPADASRKLIVSILEDALAAGDDRTQLERALARIDGLAVKDRSADSKYVRGRILAMLDEPQQALESFEAALAIDPAHPDAHYSAGLLLASMNREPEAIDHWTAAARANPPHGDAAYNAGQFLYNGRRFAEALDMWRVALSAMPDDFNAAKKVVQALHALDRHADADAAKKDVVRIYTASNDPAVKKQRGYVIDQFAVKDRTVMVFEAIGPTNPDLHYHWTAVVSDARGRPELTFQLESSAVIREQGSPFIDGLSKGTTHKSFGTYPALPPYGEWRATAMKRIASEL